MFSDRKSADFHIMAMIIVATPIWNRGRNISSIFAFRSSNTLIQCRFVDAAKLKITQLRRDWWLSFKLQQL